MTDRQLQIAFHMDEISKHARAAARLEAQGLVDRLDAMQAAADKGNFEELGRLGESIEGSGDLPLTIRLQMRIERFLAKHYDRIPPFHARGGPA
jgi:hypothetical protein